MQPEWSNAQTGLQRRAWEDVLRPVAALVAERARAMSVEVVEAIDARLPDLGADAESLEANRASVEASILGWAPRSERTRQSHSALGDECFAYATRRRCRARSECPCFVKREVSFLADGRSFSHKRQAGPTFRQSD
jgi:hypothetical protein